MNNQNQELLGEINEIRDLLGLCESKDPTDKDRINLKKLVRQLKQRNETLYDENRQLGEVIDQLKQGRFNETEGARMILDETTQQLRFELDEAKAELDQLRKENKGMRGELERAQSYQSAFQSN